MPPLICEDDMDTVRADAKKIEPPYSSVLMQLFEFIGTLVTIGAVAIAFICMLFVLSIFEANSNRLFLVNSFRVDYRPHSAMPVPPSSPGVSSLGSISQMLLLSGLAPSNGISLAWRLPTDSAPLGTTLYETFLDIYSMETLGAFHWGILLVAGLWILDSIAVFTLYFMNDVGTILTATGKPRHSTWTEWFSRTGLFFTLFALAWNFLGLILLFIITWRLSTSSENQQDTHKVPMTTQTLLVCTACFLVTILYFFRELKERFVSAAPTAAATTSFSSRGSQPAQTQRSTIPASAQTQRSTIPASAQTPRSTIPAPDGLQVDDSHETGMASCAMRRGYGRNAYTLIGYPFRMPQQSGSDLKVVSRRQYTPVLCLAWADGWALSDALILAGVVGASQNVLTHEVVAVFLSVLYASFAHSALVRLLLDGYVNEVPSEDQAYASAYADNKFRSSRTEQLRSAADTTERDLFHIRVMAFLANFAIVCFASCAPYLLFTRYGAITTFAGPFITAYIATALVVPPALWLVGNLWLELGWSALLSFRTVCLAEFIYGLVIRLLFVAMLVWNVTKLLGDANVDLDSYVLLWTGGA